MNSLYDLLAWAGHLEEEILYWKRQLAIFPQRWASVAAGENKWHYMVPELAQLPASARILDVGCGPVCRVSMANCPPDATTEGCDPLAPAYAALLDAARLRPANPPRQAFGECLAECYPADTFDCVNARNSLDHAVDPVCCLQHMLYITKPGGFVRLESHEREGKQANYTGLHQTDVYEEDGVLWFQKHEQPAVNVTALLAPYADAHLYWNDKASHDRRNLISIFRKRASTPRPDSAWALADIQAVFATQLEACRASGLLDPYAFTAVFYGAGRTALKAWPIVQHASVLIAALIDDRPAEQGKRLHGSPVTSLEEALQFKPDVVLLALQQPELVLPKLAAQGVPASSIANVDMAHMLEQACRQCPPEVSGADALYRYVQDHPVLERVIDKNAMLAYVSHYRVVEGKWQREW